MKAFLADAFDVQAVAFDVGTFDVETLVAFAGVLFEGRACETGDLGNEAAEGHEVVLLNSPFGVEVEEFDVGMLMVVGALMVGTLIVVGTFMVGAFNIVFGHFRKFLGRFWECFGSFLKQKSIVLGGWM